jgi:hypothetical protein
MLYCRRFLMVLIIAALSQASARAGYTVVIVPSIGPNADPAFGLASQTAYNANALNALQNGLTTAGAAGPGQYNTLPGSYNVSGAFTVSNNVIPISRIVTTGFNSWNAIAPPTGVNAGQYGNSLYFGLKVTNPAGFTLSGLNLSGMSTVGDPQQNLGFSFGPAGYTFTSGKFLGISAGTTPGGPAAGQPVTSSTPNANNIALTALYGVGSADSLFGNFFSPPGSNQNTINYNLLQAGAYSYPYNESYTLGGTQFNAAQLEIQGVPEPATWTLLGVGAVGLMWRRRFARAKVA